MNPAKENVRPGGFACPGCGETIAFRHVTNTLGKNTAVVTSAGCASVVDGYFPVTATKLPFFHGSFGTTGALAGGLKAGLEMVGREKTTVLAWAGDGGTYDIGFQSLSGAAERNDDVLYVCYDNEAYMNTGIQRSSATPQGSWTTTTPAGSLEDRPKKDIMAIMAGHRIPYMATASVSHLQDLRAKVSRAKKTKGFRFLLILVPCPTGWLFPPRLTVRLARLAVNSRTFPLFEAVNGLDYKLNPMAEKIPVEEYLALQGRFKGMGVDGAAAFQSEVDRNWNRLQALAKGGC